MSMIKKVYVIHHSHFDLGYTHPQELMIELQEQYIDQALRLCEETKNNKSNEQFRWTIEATLPLLRWLEDAEDSDIELMKDAIERTQISVAALLMHTTPLNDAVQLNRLLTYKQEIEKILDIQITTAYNHDINGQPWSFADIVLDAGIDFYMTGINIHFGGIPFSRPKLFQWEAPSNEKLLSFLGEHYSLFSQFLETDFRNTSKMRKGLTQYIKHLDDKGYDKEYLVLTATNPPLLDNNPPDKNLLKLINTYNEEYSDHSIELVTTEMLRDIMLESVDADALDTYRGDWTDYWNFGAGSTPLEVKYNKVANNNLKKAEVLESLTSRAFNQQYHRVKENAVMNNLLYNEHTWGAAESINQPKSARTIAQKLKKATYAYDALAQSAFVLNNANDVFLNTPKQIEDLNYITYTNTSSVTQEFYPQVFDVLLSEPPYLSAVKSNYYLESYDIQDSEEVLIGDKVSVEPYSTVYIPIEDLKQKELKEIPLSEENGIYIIETSNYRVKIDVQTGRVIDLYNPSMDWNIIEDSDYGFFDLIQERVDATQNEDHRDTFFPRDIDKGNYSISVWNHEWKAKRNLIDTTPTIKVLKSEHELEIRLVYDQVSDNIASFEKSMVFMINSNDIQIKIKIKRNHLNEPNSQYLSIPLNLNNDWKSIFEASDTLVELDEEQMGNVSKDWVTINNSIAMFDDSKGAYIVTADAPLVQFGEFNFGQESKTVKRDENPLFLSWIYNNYWDTNFNVSDDNEVTHEYIFSPFNNYSSKAQVELGLQVAKPVVMGWAETLGESEEYLEVQTDNSQVLSIIRLDSSTIQFFVKNYTKEHGSLSVSIPNKEITSVYLTNLNNERLADIEVSENKADISLKPNKFYYINVSTNE